MTDKSEWVLEPFDAGLLGGHSGCSTEWWHDYIRSLLASAHDFYAAMLSARPTPPDDLVEQAFRAGFQAGLCGNPVLTDENDGDGGQCDEAWSAYTLIQKEGER